MSLFYESSERSLLKVTDIMFISDRFELDAILNILKEAESLNDSQFAFE